MAISEKDILRIQKQSRDVLLLKGENHYHLISLTGKEKPAAFEKLLRVYPCSDEKLRELGFRFSAFRRDRSHAVVLQGYAKGDRITLWLGNSREFTLGLDYSEAFLSQFFEGCAVVKRVYPQKESVTSPFVKIYTVALGIFSIICGLLFWINGSPNRLWGGLCVVCYFAIVATVLFSPDFLNFRYKKSRGHAFRRKMVYVAYAVTGLAITLRTLEDFQISNGAAGKLALISLVGVGLLFLIAWVLKRDIFSSLGERITVAILVAVVGWGTVGQINFLADRTSPQQTTAVVLELTEEFHARGGTSCLCVVQFADGGQQEFMVSRRIYRQMEVGSSVQIFYYGGMVIPYAMIEPL